MKRDMDLVRTILLEIEAHEDPLKPVPLQAPGYSPQQISYHVKLLSEAGLIEAHKAGGMGTVHWFAMSLTWRGHEFLEATRSDTIWQKVKAESKDRGVSLPFDLVQAVALKLIAAHMGLSQS